MGPRAGLAEIALPAVQPGSSIMPGKVNPSVPEMVNQVCFQVIGCDTTVALAARGRAARAERDDAGDRLERAARVDDPARGDAACCGRAASTASTPTRRARASCSTAAPRVATALSPYIGYAATAEIAKDVGRRPAGRSASWCSSAGCSTTRSSIAILSVEAMTQPGIVGSRSR